MSEQLESAETGDVDNWHEWDPDDGPLYECPACCALVRWWSIEEHKRWHRQYDGGTDA